MITTHASTHKGFSWTTHLNEDLSAVYNTVHMASFIIEGTGSVSFWPLSTECFAEILTTSCVNLRFLMCLVFVNHHESMKASTNYLSDLVHTE